MQTISSTLTLTKKLIRYLLIIALSTLYSSIITATARAQGTLTFPQQVNVIYGESITFDLTLPSETQYSSASLFVVTSSQQEAVEIAASPNDDGFQAVTDVDTLTLPPATSLSFWWRLRGVNGTIDETSIQVFRYHDTNVQQPWRQADFKDVTVFISSDEDELADIGAVTVQQAVRQQSQALGIDYGPEIPLTLYIYPDLGTLSASLRSHDTRIQDWVAAYSLPADSLIMVADDGTQHGLENNIRHEVAHIIIAAAANNADVPAWFNEGFALNTRSEPDRALEQILNQALRDDAILPITSLCEPNFAALPPQEAALAYTQSASLYRYILERYGASQTRALLTTYADGSSCGAGIQRVLGLPMEQLEQQWLTAAQRAAVEANSSFSYSALILIWAMSIMLALLFVSPQIPRRLIRDYS